MQRVRKRSQYKRTHRKREERMKSKTPPADLKDLAAMSDLALTFRGNPGAGLDSKLGLAKSKSRRADSSKYETREESTANPAEQQQISAWKEQTSRPAPRYCRKSNVVIRDSQKSSRFLRNPTSSHWILRNQVARYQISAKWGEIANPA